MLKFDGKDDYAPLTCPVCGSREFDVGFFALRCRRCGYVIPMTLIVRTYNRALSEEEIKKKYEELKKLWRILGVKVGE